MLHGLCSKFSGTKLINFRAVWTRFHPIAYAVQDVIHSGMLGKVKRFSADFSSDNDLDSEACALSQIKAEPGSRVPP